MTSYKESLSYQRAKNQERAKSERARPPKTWADEHPDRRTSQGAVMPTFYLMLELILIGLLIYMVSQAHLTWLTIIAIGAGLYMLASSSLPRYQAVLARQKNPNHEAPLSPQARG